MLHAQARLRLHLSRACCVLLCLFVSYTPAAHARARTAPPSTTHARLSAQDRAFLTDLERRTFRYFWEQADPQTGLVLDRAHTDGRPPQAGEPSYKIASSAAT